jgi:glycosyltransferase involved in cell wall biosynthesis
MTFPLNYKIQYDKSFFSSSDLGVSIVVPLYNYEKYIESTLNSIYYQKYSNIELIVINDYSFDNSEEIVLSWINKNYSRFSRIVYLFNENNYGLSISRNIGFEIAKNDFVFVLDADNEIYPSAINKLLNACINSGASASYSQLEFFDSVSKIGMAYCWDPQRLVYGNYIDAMALIRKSAWKSVGGYDDLEFGWEDYGLWCKFVEKGLKAVFVPQILCRYRVHQSSMLNTETNKNSEFIIQKIITRFPWLKLET